MTIYNDIYFTKKKLKKPENSFQTINKLDNAQN